MSIDLSQVAGHGLACWLKHHRLQARKVLLLQAGLNGLALIQAEPQGPRTAFAIALHLLQSVLQDLQSLQARLQIHTPLLHLLGLDQIRLHMGHQLAVAHVGPGPGRQQSTQQDHATQKGGIAQAQLVATGVLLHQLTIGKDHLGEQLLQEEATLGIHRGRGALLQLQAKLAGHTLAGPAGGLPLLHGAGEIKATEDRSELIGVLFKQRGDEGAQRRLERRKFQREGQHARRQLLTAMQGHARHRCLFQAGEQLIKVLIKLRYGIRSRRGVIRQRGAPDLVTLCTITVFEEIHETGNQIGLGEDHIDRREDFQLLGQLLHALAQLARQVNGELGLVGAQLRHADGDDHAIQGSFGAVLLEQRQEAQPLAAVFFVHRVAARCVQQDAFGREVPIAVTGAANALNDVVGVVGKGKLQTRHHHRRAFTRSRVANHGIPGQLIQRG